MIAQEQLLDLIEECVRMHCVPRDADPEAPPVLNSMGTSTYAEALRVLARAGRVILLQDRGRYVTARWPQLQDLSDGHRDAR